jgi:hypothetical protein
VVLAVCLVVGLGGRPASAASPGDITLLSQTPYINGQGMFDLQLSIDTAGQRGDYVQVLILPRLTNRTEFQNASTGKYQGYEIYQPTAAVANLQADPSGGVDLEIPFNLSNPPAASGSVLPPFPSSSLVPDSVYPLQVGLYNTENQPIGQALHTFVVYSRPQSLTGYTPLSVALVLPVTSPVGIGRDGQVGRLDNSESLRLSQLVGAVASHPQVPVNLEVTPEVLDALSIGDVTDQETLATLRQMVSSRQVDIFPETYIEQPIGDFLSAGLPNELNAQFKAGDDAFLRDLGVTPSTSTWLINGPLDAGTLSAVASRGGKQVIIPDSDLTPVPSSVVSTIYGSTYAWGTQLGTSSGPNLAAFSADGGLTGDFNRVPSTAMAATQLLAEIAMVQAELPGLARGIVVMPPAGWTPSPAFVSTLLAGLTGDPIVRSVGASQLFDPTSNLVKSVTRNLSDSQPSPLRHSPFSTDTAVRTQTARNQVAALASVVPGSQPMVTQLENELLLSESGTVPDPQRKTVVESISKAATTYLNRIQLPSVSSITLTSTRGSVPLTILAPPSLHAQVLLVLKSQKLLFEKFVPPDGNCQVSDQTTETCNISLVGQNTTLKVPVQSRSPGKFEMTVALFSPNGVPLGRSTTTTIRSTAISNVGLILIVVALISLAIWWGRDLHRGRRAKKLIPPPEVTDDEAVSDDPIVNAFFAQPPPDLPEMGERTSGGGRFVTIEGGDESN